MSIEISDVCIYRYIGIYVRVVRVSCVCFPRILRKFYENNSRVKSSSFVTNVWLTKFDGTLGYFKQNKLPRCFLKSGESSVEPKIKNGY